MLKIASYNVENLFARPKVFNTLDWSAGKFDRQPNDNTKNVEIIATGRDDWIGWVELAKEPTNEKTTRLTARVIQDVDADIIGIVEAEEVRRIVDGLVAQGQHVVVLGDLNEGIKSDGNPSPNFDPLFNSTSPLIDCYSLEQKFLMSPDTVRPNIL